MSGTYQKTIERYVTGTLFGVVLFVGASRTFAQPGPSFQGLGSFPGPDTSPSSRANGISPDGLVVVGSSSHPVVTGADVAVRWFPASGVVENMVESLGGTTQSHARSASADGSVVVGELEFQFEAFRWTQDGGVVGLGDLPGGVFQSSANDVSADGSVVVGTGCSEIDFEAFRWTEAEGMVGLGDLPGGTFRSGAGGVSADGTVIVGSSFSANGLEAFHWTADEGMVGLGDLPGGLFSSGASDVSADGRVVVGSSEGPSGIEPFRWTLIEGMIGLGFLEGTDIGGASDVSDDGSVIVGNARELHVQNSAEQFIWDPINGLRDLRSVLENDLGLDLTGWILFDVTGISGDGRVIVGTGNPPDPHRFIEAWMAVLNECGTDADCSDGLFCNGVETCVANVCVPGADLCPAGDPCIEASRVCASAIPTLSQWSLIAMALLLTVAATCVLKQRKAAAR